MSRRRALLLGVLGVLLLVGGATVSGSGHETVYEYGAVEAGEPSGHLQVNVADCDWRPLQSRDCAVARYLGNGNEIRLDNETAISETVLANEWRYDYVDLRDGFYRPTTTYRNGTLVLGLERVPTERAMAAAAVNITEPNEDLHRAIEGGTFTSTEEVPEYRRYFQHDGDYYRLRTVATERRDTGSLSFLPGYARAPARLLAGAVGAALLWRGGEASERADSRPEPDKPKASDGVTTDRDDRTRRPPRR
ncbi:hypothetical protein [Halobacterium litoreum]|uniref:DUF3068 domain-containing protein n=1 Tax=Halobacterium litoreum TaxID=2039234 RepID=A0ABD5NBM5_9EURY|nr:hypothetical protein [Halobacterium litoreum]UHH14442.1 hypothetical protein LT972_05445 [Halobacterium litoreum]